MVGTAPFAQTPRCLQHLPFLVIDRCGNQLSRLTQKLRYLVRGELERSVEVEVDAVERRRRPSALRPFNRLREPETRVCDDCQLDSLPSSRGRYRPAQSSIAQRQGPRHEAIADVGHRQLHLGAGHVGYERACGG